MLDMILEKHKSEYAEEAEERWGSSKAYQESKERVGKMSREILAETLNEHGEIAGDISVCMKEGLSVEDEKVQDLVQMHYNWLGNFYTPNIEIYLGLSEMYVNDPRFKKTYDDMGPGLAQYLSQAMKKFVEVHVRETL